jgi:hypothetical protein
MKKLIKLIVLFSLIILITNNFDSKIEKNNKINHSNQISLDDPITPKIRKPFHFI